jgi:CRISPR type III-A-associated protein Csm2
MTQYRQQQGRYPPGREQRLPSLPARYLQAGYFDDKGNVLPEAIQQWPEELAQTLRRTGLTSTQMRRFFNRAREIERQLDANQPFDRLKEQILALKPIAAASVGKGNTPELFKNFMDKNVYLAVRSPEAFKRGFLPHFQSVVAYLKYFEKKG